MLAAAGLTKGKCLTCYEHVRFELEQAGGTFHPEQVARDGRIITAQTWQSHPEFYREIFACLAPHAETGQDAGREQDAGAALMPGPRR